MEVQNVYQDDEGKWHIDYGSSHLMGLAIRVYFGQLLIGLIVIIPIAVLSALTGFILGKSLPEKENAHSSPNVQQEFICNEISE